MLSGGVLERTLPLPRQVTLQITDQLAAQMPAASLALVCGPGASLPAQ
jgi:hypothetical protein